MRRAQVKPLVLEAKEAVSLINGTQGMLAVGVLALLAAETLADTADVIGALALDALRGTDVAFDERIHKARPHSGQLKTAANLRKMLEGSQIRESHRDCDRVQDAYSLRCMPQVHGAVRNTLAHCREVMEIEVNSAVDNPLVFMKSNVGTGASARRTRISARLEAMSSPAEISTGATGIRSGFPGIALSALAGISERRLERMVNPALSEGLPPFLAAGAGLNSGFMMPQVAAALWSAKTKCWRIPRRWIRSRLPATRKITFPWG